MNKIIATSMKTYFQLRAYTLDLWKKTAKSSQDLILFDLLNTARATEFGKKYHFEDIYSYDDFKKNVPILKYEDIYPYIEKMLQGKHDILWPGFISNFSKSSGTTNDVSKYIPVSHDSLFKNNYAAGKDLYTLFFKNYPESKLFDNKGSVLALGGSISDPDEFGICRGDVSAILMSKLPSWAQEYREPRMDVALMSDWRDKIPAIIDDCLDKNISHILGVPTWFVSLFDEIKKRFPEKKLLDIWPNMELFIHGAVSFEPYRTIFENFFPHENMKYIEVYNASEGFFAIQDDPNLKGEMLLLTDHGVFYEFIPMSEYGNKDAQSITLEDVKIGVDYALIISTNAGLWRYDIGDTVQFTSIDPYRIKISGRTKHHINVFGEELMVGNTDMALVEVCKKHDALLGDYTAGPIFMNEHGKGSHEWIIEFKKEPINIKKFTTDLDLALQNINTDYKAKRQDDIALQELILHVAKQGTFESWMEKRGKLGAQNKVPRLSNTRKYLDEIFEFIK